MIRVGLGFAIAGLALWLVVTWLAGPTQPPQPTFLKPGVEAVVAKQGVLAETPDAIDQLARDLAAGAKVDGWQAMLTYKSQPLSVGTRVRVLELSRAGSVAKARVQLVESSVLFASAGWTAAEWLAPPN